MPAPFGPRKPNTPAIDTVPTRAALDPDFDSDNYASEIAAMFDLATRAEGGPRV